MRNKFCTLALAGIFTLSLAGSAVLAQDNQAPPQQQDGRGRRGMDPDEQLKRLTKTLDLTADQQTQIKPILESQQQQIQALRGDQSMSREDRMAKIKGIREDSRTKIEAALNDTQKQKYEAMEARMQERMRDRQQGGGAHPQ